MITRSACSACSSIAAHARRFGTFLTLFALLSKGNPQPGVNSGNPVALKGLSLEQLSALEITTPSKEPQPAMKAPVAVYVITGEDIRRSGATCIPEALRAAPGVEVARIDGNKWSIGIRGFGSRLSRSVLVLMDGRTVYTELFAGTYWEVQDTNMDDIDRIEVIRGPGGTIWGPNAVDGVINVITKSSTETKGTRANLRGGNEEQGSADIRYGGDDGGNLSYRVYGKGFTRSPEYHPDGQNFDDWRAAQGGFRVDWKRNDRDSFTFQGDIYDEKAGEFVNATSYAPPYSQNIQANALLSGGNILARWTRTSQNGEIQAQIYYDRTNRYEPNLADHRNTFDGDFLQRINAPGRQQISWGFGARSIGIYDPIVVTGVQFLPIRRTDWLVSGFLQDQIELVKNRLTATVGSKVLRTNFTGVQLEPSGRLAWTPSDRSTFWTAFTHAVRTPSDSEENFYLLGYVGQAAPNLQAFARFNPNPAFAPEQLNGYEFGYRRLIRKSVYVDFASFLNRYHNLFSEDITGGFELESTPAPEYLLLPAQFRNDLYGRTEGFEIAPEWRPKSFWRLRASWSYLDMHIRTIPGAPEVGTAINVEGGSPHSEVMLQSDLDISKNLQFDVRYRYIGDLPCPASPSAGVCEYVPGYSSADVHFAWQVRPSWQVSLVGQNLLQPHHVEDVGDPGTLVGIVRSGYVKLTWTH
jgi:iron complex outermembrane receptor protein